jgi:CheY-like chemotaxis protein
VETLLALSSPQKTQKLSQRLQRQVTRVRGVKDLLKRLETEEPLLVIVDIALPSLSGKQLVDQLRGKVQGDHLVLVHDLANFDPGRLLDALEAGRERKVPRSRARGAPRLHPELHNPESGRIDARRVAGFFGLSLAKLAKALGRSPQSVHKTPDSARLQKGLGLFLRIAAGLIALLGSEGDGRIWLNTPSPDLDNTRPLELIEEGQGEIVAELLEDALLGHPG